ncbi:hypothetical protein SBRCBS47491_006270 [Sporothrix bragantina]|uniref:DNA endonuclease activator Ctp1 C-terminal domain-containing protein n=1 Tax=Sporothrix bragantina TaxID=671064 RepID=A0ABP0C3R6_9PEZI
MAETIRMEREWLRQAIDNAFNNIQIKLDEDLEEQSDDWSKRYRKLQTESLETKKRMESEIKGLQDQVASLQSALERAEAARPASAPFAEASSNTAASDNVPAGDVESGKNMAEVIEELQQSLEKSQMRHEAVKTQLEAAVALVRKRKAETLNWVQYADSLELKIKKMEKKKMAGRQSTVPPSNPSLTPVTEPPAPPPTTMSPTPAIIGNSDKQLAQLEVAKPSLSASFSSSTSSSFLGNSGADDESPETELPQKTGSTETSLVQQTAQGPTNQPVLESTQGEPSPGASQPELPTPRATNSGDFAYRVAVKNEPSSDGPEIIWERATKKPKREDQNRSSLMQTPQILPVVKRESSGGTQRVLGLGVYRESQESIDLDEGQLTVQTPRKRQLYFEQQGILERESDESSESASQEQPAGPEASSNIARQPSAQPFVPPPRPAPSTPYAPSTPLAPLSTNIRRGTKGSVKALNLLKRGIESLAEDNQAYRSPDGVSRKTAMEPPCTIKSTRLDSLLNSRPSDPSPLSSLSRPTPSTVQRFNNSMSSPIAGLFGRPPPTRTLPHLRDGDAASPLLRMPNTAPRAETGIATPMMTKLSTPAINPLTASLQAAKASSAAKKTPALRSRPVDQLKMDDFKINPALNNGETFAYNEVVRGRADRANLAGCTDPQCCGKAFRGMATSELDAAGPAHIRHPENIVLMERHLGNDAFLLAQMDPDEKRELWIEARTKELADKFGKHRHRYHRRASPPGFWDTDFPTTQDEEQHRAEAEKVERITVQERYREAMRPGGGRWLFRDE